ncbi:MAG TPA: glutamyl-tRNA reductase [Candidatus Limnocylindria bacterium]|nr:glutamyl-tRNA reductase [Candidatus Limnocylindria bacterium]
MSLVVLGLSHKSCPVEIREKFSFVESRIAESLERLCVPGLASEAVILSTCNRVEIYAAADLPTAEFQSRLQQFLGQEHGHPVPVGAGLYTMADAACLEHLFRVASGLDSLVLGETEILGQLKKAYDLALQKGFSKKVLNKSFQRAFTVAKQIRTETNIQRGNTSVASVAVETAERIFDDLRHREVLVIGAGDTSEKTARALLSRGAKSIMVSNRTFDRAAALAAELGGRAVRFDDWEAEFAKVDIVVSATGAPHYILDRPKMERLMQLRGRRPLLLLDLAVPRDVDPNVANLDGVFVVNVDDLQSVAEDHLRQRKEEIARCDAIIREKAAGWIHSLSFPMGFRAAASS